MRVWLPIAIAFLVGVVPSIGWAYISADKAERAERVNNAQDTKIDCLEKSIIRFETKQEQQIESLKRVESKLDQMRSTP